MALIEILNDFNTVLIDDNYSNACMAYKGVLPLSASVNAQDCYQVQISYSSAAAPQLALELNDIQIAATFTARTGNTWTWYVFFKKAYVNRSINYYIFTVPSQIGGNGLVQLFDATGKLVFDSDLKYLIVKNFYQGAPGNNSLGTDLVTGRTYAAIAVAPHVSSMHLMTPAGQPSPPYNFVDANALGLYYRSGNALMHVGAITYSGQNQSDDPNSHNTNSGNTRVLLIDVTGY